MSERDPMQAMKSALLAIRSSDSNAKPLRYAPWVLGLMLIIFIRDRVPALDAEDWMKAVGFVVALPILSRLAQGQLDKQRERAETRLEQLLGTTRGIKDWTELQATGRFQGIRLADRVQRAVINAAMAQQKRDEERRGKALKEAAQGDHPRAVAAPRRELAATGR